MDAKLLGVFVADSFFRLDGDFVGVLRELSIWTLYVHFPHFFLELCLTDMVLRVTVNVLVVG